MGKTLNARVYITKEKIATYEIPQINSVLPTTNYNSITADLTTLAGTSEIDKYYFAIEEISSPLAFNDSKSKVRRLANTNSLEWIETDEPTYTFNNLKENTSYKVYSYGRDKNGINSNIYETIIRTEEYALPQITDLISTSIGLNTISVKVISEEGSNRIDGYKFSKDDGQTWSDKQGSEYTFNNLQDTTEYKIKVKAIDIEGRESSEYYKTISTETYINPTVNTVNATTTWNSVTLSTNATGGTNNIEKYYYKKSTDSDWIESTSSTYTFNNLTENTTYNFQVKTIDTLGRFSLVKDVNNIVTDAYVLPSITATVSEVTSSSFIVNSTAKNGTGNVVSYSYSKDGGSNWSE